MPNDAITLEEPSVIALIYEKINEAVERGIQMQTTICQMYSRDTKRSGSSQLT